MQVLVLITGVFSYQETPPVHFDEWRVPLTEVLNMKSNAKTYISNIPLSIDITSEITEHGITVAGFDSSGKLHAWNDNSWVCATLNQTGLIPVDVTKLCICFPHPQLPERCIIAIWGSGLCKL